MRLENNRMKAKIIFQAAVHSQATPVAIKPVFSVRKLVISNCEIKQKSISY